MTNKNLTVGLLITLVIAIVALFYPKLSQTMSLGAASPTDISATNFTEVTASNGMYIGAGGMTIAGGGLSVVGDTTLTTGTMTFGGVTMVGVQADAISTTTAMCIVPAPTATSSFVASLVFSQSTTSTTYIGLATSSSPTAATTSYNSLLSLVNGSGGMTPGVYKSGTNMFAIPGKSLVFYYTNGTTNGALAQGQLGTCSAVYTGL